MADEMSNSGMDALSAVKARTIDQLTAAGDRLVASCNACHVAFKPDLPSMGLYKSPDYPPPQP
jgi:cytochrome c556